MREIKFRVWDDANKDMDYWDLQDRNYYACSGEERYHIMQYIGLEDKNGEEIYEGDILKHEGGTLIEVVEWKEEMWTEEGFMTGFGELTFSTNQYEIIGNIYENPELIKK